MAKLYGTADPVLVSAAFKHGASNIPMDLKTVYKDRVTNVKNFADEIGKAFDKIYADDKATNDLLTDVSTQALDLMETGGGMNDEDMAMNYEIVNGYKQRIKDITDQYGKLGKDGDIQRSKLRAEMNTYLANVKKNSETYQNLVKLSSNSVLLGNPGDPHKELLTKIIEDQNNNTNFVKREYDKGKIYFSIPSKSGETIRMTMSEINDGVAAENPALLGNVNKVFTNVQKDGQLRGGVITDRDLKTHVSSIKNLMSDYGEILNVSQGVFGNMDYSFDEVLTGRAKKNGVIDTDLLNIVYDELEKLGGADLDDDGDVDQDDMSLLQKAKANGELYVDAKNGMTLIDAIKKDKQLHRDLLANYLGETAVKDFYGRGSDLYKAPKTDNEKNKNKYFKLNQNFGGGVTGGVLNKLIDDLDSGTINIGGKEYNVNPNNNSWSSKDGDTKSGNDVLQYYYDAYGSDFAFYNDTRFAKYRGRKTKEEELVTSSTIEDVENNVKEFFVDLNMLDSDGNYIPYKATGIDKVLGGSDLRMGKNRIELKEKINNFLKQAGIEDKVVTTSIGSANSINLNGKQYTFKQGTFEKNYKNLIKDLSDILKGGNVSQINFG